MPVPQNARFDLEAEQQQEGAGAGCGIGPPPPRGPGTMSVGSVGQGKDTGRVKRYV